MQKPSDSGFPPTRCEINRENLYPSAESEAILRRMPRTAHPMTAISAALEDLRKAMHGLVAEHATMRQQLQSLFRNGASPAGSRRGRPAGRASGAQGGPKKRGR